MNEVKKVELTIRDLMDSEQSLVAIEALELDSKTAYWVGKVMKKIRAQFNQVAKRMTESRRALLTEIGTEVMVDSGLGDGTTRGTGQFQIKQDDIERMAKFQERMDEVLERTVELEITPISIASLGDVKLTPRDVANLDWLIIE